MNGFAAVFLLALAVPDAPEERIIVRAPDHGAYVSWSDMTEHLRRIEVKTSPEARPVFSEDTLPRHTQADWDPTSTRCLIADAPDSGTVHFWLVSRDDDSSNHWSAVRFDPSAALSAAHAQLAPEVHAPRLAPLKAEWISPSKVRVRITCSEGVFLLTLDATAPNAAPAIQKVSDKRLEE